MPHLKMLPWYGNQNSDLSKETYHTHLMVVKYGLAFNQCGMASQVSAQLGFHNVSLREREKQLDWVVGKT